MIPGMGAVATTFVAGVEAIRKGIAKPIGSLTQMGTIRLGKRTDGRSPKIKEFVPLAVARRPRLRRLGHLRRQHVRRRPRTPACSSATCSSRSSRSSQSITPRTAVFDHNYVKKLDGPNVKKGKNKMDLAEQLRADIRDFKKTSGASRLVTIWCGSTEIFIEPTAAHQSREGVREGVDSRTTRTIAPSMIYAYASLMEGVPFANGAPNLTVDIPALLELSRENEAPICGKDFKTGQTLMKTILAPGFKARMLGLSGWYSTNILGNRDGEVLDDPGVVQDQGRVEAVGARAHPAAGALSRPLRQDLPTRCASTTTRRAATTKKAGTTSTSSAGSAIRCRSRSTSCAATRFWPRRIVLDLALFLDLAQRAGIARTGIQEWLSFYFKSPMTRARALSRARSVHPADEAEEHAAAPAGRGADHAPGTGVLLSLRP